MKKLLSLFLTFSILSISYGQKYYHSDYYQSQLTIYTGPAESTYNEMGLELEEAVNKGNWFRTFHDTIHYQDEHGAVFTEVVLDTIYLGDLIKTKTSSGSDENLWRLEREAHSNLPILAFSQNDVLEGAGLKDANHNQNNTDQIKVLLSLGYEQVHLFVRADSKITSLKKLKNKTVSIGAHRSGTHYTMKVIEEATSAKWKTKEHPLGRSMAMLLKGDIDAFFFVGAGPVPKFDIPSLEGKVKLLSIESEELAEIYKKVTIPSGTYPWLTEDITTYGVNIVLIGNDFSQDPQRQKQIKDLMEIIKTKMPNLQETGHPQWKNFDAHFQNVEWEINSISKEVFGIK